MYILDAPRLRDDLVHNRVPPSDLAIYAFLVAGVSLPIWVPEHTEHGLPSGLFALGAFLGHLVVAAYGTRTCYIANGGSTGHDFLNRFIPLGWVVGVRFALQLAIPLGLLSFVISKLSSTAIADGALEIALLGAGVVYFRRLSLQISLVRDAAGPAA
jgi:hypothetical protein